ncbi:MAG: GTPase ObgE [Desulfobacterales bacterium]
MKFIDEALITVRAGDGGSGCVSFRRERFVPKGGPDGGDGGKGGDVILLASPRKRTLHHFRFKRNFEAQSGKSGQGKEKTGRSGEDLILEVPPGTVAIDADTGEIIKDFIEKNERFTVAAGGRGGQGNAQFKSAVRQTPRFAQPGEPGQQFRLKLELKILADVGIIGFPNAGKSTLVRAISSARPKVADYPFTTLTPNLGVVTTDRGEPFVVADIPGLIEGAHTGAGLGTRFLRHIERTRILLHLIDASEIDPDEPLSRYETINRELTAYSPELAKKKQIVVLSKMDISGADVGAEFFRMSQGSPEFIGISAAAGHGLEELKYRMQQVLEDIFEHSDREPQDNGR